MQPVPIGGALPVSGFSAEFSKRPKSDNRRSRLDCPGDPKDSNGKNGKLKNEQEIECAHSSARFLVGFAEEVFVGDVWVVLAAEGEDGVYGFLAGIVFPGKNPRDTSRRDPNTLSQFALADLVGFDEGFQVSHSQLLINKIIHD